MGSKANVHRERRCLLWAVRMLWVTCALVFGCIAEEGECDAHQVQVPGMHQCVCEEGYVLGAEGYGCVACGANLVEVDGVCECAPAYLWNEATEACEMVEGSAPGAPCGPNSPCTEPSPYCVLAAEEPYCAPVNCQRNDDCPRSWLCDSSADPVHCRRAVGLEVPCAEEADCVGFDATYCEITATQSCYVRDCRRNPTVCPSQWGCCDFEGFLGESLCIPLALLAGGECPDGKEPINE